MLEILNITLLTVI